MRILVAEDELVSRRLLEMTLKEWGYEVDLAADGTQAWDCLHGGEAPELAILDWMMPGMDGVTVCRKIREARPSLPIYLILLTSRSSRVDFVQGLEGGADDFMTKPFERAELRARVRVGERMIELQRSLAAQVRSLEEALGRVRQLQGLLPICSYCKKIRNDKNYWQHVDSYIAEHSEAQFSHCICPECCAKAASSGHPTS